MFPVTYDNGNCKVTIHADGTKVREWPINTEPLPDLPESIDLKITNWCDAGCKWCHENSTVNGKDAHWDNITELLTNLPKGMELAIGGGDPMSYGRNNDEPYSQIENLLTLAKSCGLICNITVNGLHFARHENKLKEFVRRELLHGVGISWSGEVYDWDYDNLVYHVIAGVHPTSVLNKLQGKKVLVLGYKEFGRGKEFMRPNVSKNISDWKTTLPIVSMLPKILAFDTLAISQLRPVLGENFMGEEGTFSMYVDAVENEYAVASYAPTRHTFTNIKDAFKQVREGKML